MLRCCRSAIRCIINYGGNRAALRCSTYAPFRTRDTHRKLNCGNRPTHVLLDSVSSFSETARKAIGSPEEDKDASAGDICLSSDASSAPAVTPDASSHRDSLAIEPAESVKLQSRHTYTRALEALRQFLSANDATPNDGSLPTPNTLRSLYISVKHRSQLRCLSSSQLSDLISLFGSLSLPQPRPRCTYLHPSVAYYDQHYRNIVRTYWPFVLHILRDKAQLGHPLTGRDRFWFMRAVLANLDADCKMEVQDTDRVLDQARKQYLKIYRDSSDAEVHLPYLKALLFVNTPAALDELVTCLSRILTQFSKPSTRFLRFFWTLVLDHLNNASTVQKERILDAILLSLQRSQSFQLVRPATLRPGRALHAGLSFAVASTVLPISLKACLTQPTIHWVAYQLHSAISPELPSQMRWNNLVLLAKCSVREETTRSLHILGDPPASNVSTVQWDTMVSIKLLERDLQLQLACRPTMQSDTHYRDRARSLWKAWKNAPTDSSRPVLVTSAIVVTFFRLSAKLSDVRLKDACHRFCLAEGLYTDGPPSQQANRLIVEYIMASLACGYQNLPDIVARLESSITGGSWKPDVLAMTVQHLIREQPALAVDFLEYAVTSLSESQWSLCQRRDLLDAVLSAFHLSGLEKIHGAHGRTIAEAMAAVYTKFIPPARSRYAIQHTLLAIVGSGHSSAVMDIVKAIQRQSSGFLHDEYLSQLIRAFLRCRQFRAALGILRMFNDPSSMHARSIHQGAAMIMARSGASTLSRKIYSTNIGPRRSARESLLRSVKFRPVNPSRLSALQVIPKVSRALNDPELVKDAISILVHANRTLAARKLFRRTYKNFNAKTRTEIGNIILHGLVHRMKCRNGRLVRNVLRTADFLAKHYDFVRDRVTINILLKAMLRWRTFIDISKVKALFDHMIRGGYPAASQFRQGDVPFSTPPSAVTTLPLPPLPPFISFERHVRPMYKMFIKAFHLRGDTRAAAMVVGILKAEERRERARREERNRARATGRLKAEERRAKLRRQAIDDIG